jgi:hypothetical protein
VKIVIGLGVFLAGAVFFFIEWASYRDVQRQRDIQSYLAQSITENNRAEALLAAARAPTPEALIAQTRTLSDALAIARPAMADQALADKAPSAGARLLAGWMVKHAFWDELMTMPDAKRAEVMKDSESMRGRRLCVTGRINQIFRDKTVTDTKIFLGVMMIGYSGFVRFIATGNTTDVLEGRTARFCGITPGLHEYATQDNTQITAVQLVGSFDRVFLDE